MRERSEKLVWLSCILTLRLACMWLTYHTKQGMWSWDVALTKLLQIVLLTDISSWPGDVARSQEYTRAQYVLWRHVRMQLRNDAVNDHPHLEDIEIILELLFVKEQKNWENESDFQKATIFGLQYLVIMIETWTRLTENLSHFSKNFFWNKFQWLWLIL